MREFLTSRSRRLESETCERLRYWAHEWHGQGLEPTRVKIPLVTGAAVHGGLAALLKGAALEDAVEGTLLAYDAACKDRELDLEVLADQSRIYNEQRALIEALVRLAGMRVIPRLLEQYEVLEVERMDKASLYQGSKIGIVWRSIPDALLRNRIDGDLYLLSWKTCAEYDALKELDARVDMQGLSEAWAVEERFRNEHVKWAGYPEKIRGVQMIYLIKGRKIPLASTAAAGKSWRTNSPLIYGYKDQSFPPKLATSRTWKCSAPHAMRKSKWYPSGECPGDGRNHLRGDDWTSFPVADAMGVKAWMEMLEAGAVSPEAGDPLEMAYAIPMPYFRQAGHVESWLRQTRAQELYVAYSIRMLEVFNDPDGPEFQEELDERFPQSTSRCTSQWGAKCPMMEICWGPEHVRADPIGSGLFRPRTQYQEVKEDENEG